MSSITLEYTNNKGINCSAVLFRLEDKWWVIGNKTCFWYEQNSSGQTLKEAIDNQVFLFESWEVPKLNIEIEE